MSVISLDIIDGAYDIDIEYDFKDKAEEDDITRNERTTPVVMFVDFLTASIRPSNCTIHIVRVAGSVPWFNLRI